MKACMMKVHAFHTGGEIMEQKFKQMLFLLLNSQYVPVQEISVTLKKTNRSVRNYMKELNCILNEHGASVTTVYNKGYHLQIQDETSFYEFASSLNYMDKDYNIPENRIVEIFSRLLFQNGYMKQNDLLEEFCISLKQLKEDLSIVKKLLSRFHLSIQTKPHYGMYIVGKEYDKRLCISQFHIVYGEAIYHSQIDDYTSLKEAVRNIVISCIANKSYQISENNLENLISHIALMILRVQNHQHISFDEEFNLSHTSLQYQISLSIAEMIRKILNVYLDENEIYFMTIQLLSKENKILENNSYINEEMQQLIEDMLNHIKKHFKVGLLNDLNLMLSLGQHLMPLLSRIRYKTFIHNPLTDEIKTKLCQAYEMAVVACEVINEKYHVILPEEEIAFVALHIDLAYENNASNTHKKNILIVCSSGKATEKLLENGFIKRFSHFLNQIDVVSPRELMTLQLSLYDCIFTTIPLIIETQIPIIKIEDIILEKDYEKIGNELYHIKNHFQYVREELFIKDYLCRDKESCIHDLIDRASSYYDIHPQFEEFVFKRETLGSTEFGSLIALPHSIYPVNQDTFLVIAILKKPIVWNNHKVSIVILMSVSNWKEQYQLDEVYHVITTILSHKVLQDKILKCKTFDDFKESLEEYL